jgi:hypothetical protein
MRAVYKILTRTPERKRALGRHRYKWNDNIILDLTEVGSVLNPCGSGHDPVTGFCEHGTVPLDTIKGTRGFFCSCGTINL